MDGYIVGSMISANSITGEQIQANSIKTANLELSVQKKIQDATNEETVKALIKADLDGFESTLSKEFITVENATTQIQQATEVAVKEATKSIIDNAVTESMGAVNGQLNDKLNQYTGNTLLPAIAEKAEEVLQNAEDYVVTKLESYATKQELSSSISQTREQIELSVSEKYTTKTESATIITEAIDGITVGAINRALGTSENKSFKFNGGANETWLPYKFSNDISNKEAYVSFKYTLTGTAQNGSQIEFAPSYLKKANNQTVYRPKHIFFTSNRLQDVNITDTVSFTTKDFQDISPSSTSYIRFVGNGFTGTLSISEVQIKPGNSKTSWSPAPEDVNNDIVNAKNEAIISANNTLISTIANHYTKSETDSKISVAKDEINLGISNTYETKTNVETKVTSTLNSAKSYSDTKKTEAINAASTDATNKVNSAKTELTTAIGKKANSADVYTKTEVYTKAQTDSAIKVAKDEINLGISSTYETKTNVETKISDAIGDVQVGGANLWSETAWTDGAIMADGTVSDYWLRPHVSYHDFVSVGNNKYITYQCWNPNGIVNNANYNRIVFYNLDKTLLGSVDVPMLNGEPYQCAIWEILSGTKYIRFGVVSDVEGGGYNTSLKFKFEFGNKPTEWSPNALDITNNITTAKNDAITSANNTLNTTIANYYTKSQTDSQINIAKDNITSSVSSLRTDIMNTSFTNLLLNSDFQYYQNGVNMPSHYESLDLVYCYGGGWLCPEGGKTIHINTVGSGRNWLGWKSHVIKASKDQVITASVYVATDNINSFNSNLGLEIEWLNSNYERIICSGLYFDLQSNYTWERKSVTATAPEGTTYVRIYCWHHSEGISWWGKPMLQMGSVCTAWDKGGSLDAVEQRLYSAEQKITDDSITNTVKKSFYTKEETENAITSKGYATQSQLQQTADGITSTVSQNHYTKQETENTINNKNFATSSQVQQTADNLTATFKSSGGCNLFRNSGFKCYEDKFKHWYGWNHQGLVTSGNYEINRASDDWGFPSWVTDSLVIHVVNPTNGTYVEYGMGQTVDTTAGQTYTVSCYYAMHRVTGANIVVRGDGGQWIANHSMDTSKSGGNGSVGNWGRASVTFVATSTTHSIEFMLNGVTDAGNGYLWIVQPMCNEGSVSLPYSAHPNESYDGIVSMDYQGINVATSYGAHTQFHSGGMSSYNNSNQRTLGIENGGISFHAWNNNALATYITQSSLWGGSQSANGLAISTTANGTYLALGTSSLSDVNTVLNMEQALTISANDSFQPRGINFWKDVHAHGYGIRQLSHLKLAGSGAIQFDYLNNSPSTIYEAVDSGHSLYVMGGYQMHLGCMAGTGTPKGMIWFKGQTDTHSYTHWDFHNYTMYNMRTASAYANYNTRRIGESYGVTSNVDGVRYVYRDVELVNGRAIRSIPLEYKGCEYDIVSIVCKGRGNAWVQDEDVDKFVIEGDCQSVNIEIIIHEIEQNLHTVALDEAYVEPLSQKIEPEIPTVITNVSPDTL